MTITKRKLVPSGIDAFDKAIYGGPEPGDLVVVAGAAGVGKSYFAEQLLSAPRSIRQGAMAYVTTEDSLSLMWARTAARDSDFENAPSDFHGIELADTCPGRVPARVHFMEARGRTTSRIFEHLYDLNKLGIEPSAVIVDCLQGIRADSGSTIPDPAARARAILDLRSYAHDCGFVLYLIVRGHPEPYHHTKTGQLVYEPLGDGFAGFYEADVFVKIWHWPALGHTYLKVDKNKWGLARPSFLIERDSVTGCFKDWRDAPRS